jgi:pimeloyl-ACP methyl ester carboxylesterase
MDAIRAAVGDTRLTYLGLSYGSFLGATYADLFPTHIRAMVLDGALDPALDPVAANIEQTAGFEKELADFFGYCSQDPSCPWKPKGDIHLAYEALMARIAAHPLPGTGSRTLGPGEAVIGVSFGLYEQAFWPMLATGLAKADAGDGSALLNYSDQYTTRMPDGSYGNELDTFNAVGCVDAVFPDLAALRQAAVVAKQRAPDFGVAGLYSLGVLPCTMWPTPPTGRAHAISADASPPIMVVGSTGDPATPYADAQALATELKHGFLLTRVGDGHLALPSSACIRTTIGGYLINLNVPPPATSCPTP